MSHSVGDKDRATVGNGKSSSRHQRYTSIDLLRGLVMVLMVLDHARDFLGTSAINPRDVADPGLFITRWVTHFCAPVFVFLAGASIWFAMQKSGSTLGTRRFVLLRGLWLIALELSIVRFGWTFDLVASDIILQVIWVLGCGMVFLALLMSLSPFAVGLIGAGMILTHNLLDPVQPSVLGHYAWLWHLLHVPAEIALAPGRQVMVLYPLIPWVGVMAFGFGFAPNLVPEARRARFFYAWGGGMIGLFAFLRFTGIYGDPQPWQHQPTFLGNLLEFVNCEKYPPSLQFLLMTLGPVLATYPMINSIIRGRARAVLLTFGATPLFFYIIHIPLIHSLAIALAALKGTSFGWLIGDFPLLHKPPEYGAPLLSVYFYWLLTLLLLYPACRWYASEKHSHRRWWHQLL